MSNIEQRIYQFKSTSNKTIKVRYASLLLKYHGSEIDFEVILEIINLIKHNDPTKETNLRQELDKVLNQRTDEQVYNGLIALIQDKDDLRRTIALEHIKHFNRKEHVDLLFKIIDKRNMHWWNKRQAVWALRDIDDERILPKLKPLLNNKRIKEYNYLFIVEAVVKEHEKRKNTA